MSSKITDYSISNAYLLTAADDYIKSIKKIDDQINICTTIENSAPLFIYELKNIAFQCAILAKYDDENIASKMQAIMTKFQETHAHLQEKMAASFYSTVVRSVELFKRGVCSIEKFSSLRTRFNTFKDQLAASSKDVSPVAFEYVELADKLYREARKPDPLKLSPRNLPIIDLGENPDT